MNPSDEKSVSSLSRAIAIVRALAAGVPDGLRVSELCKQLGLTQPTTHRLLQQLIDEGLVEQGEQTRRYRLAIDFFSLAARAADHGGLRELCRPSLLRLGASLGDSVFLLVRSGFDAVCLDRWEGPFPIRTYTGDIGGRVPLGVGQGALAILAHLPQAEQEEVLRYNVPRVQNMGSLDEVFVRTEAARARAQGYASTSAGVFEGMAGAAVPVFDCNQRVVAALSIGTIANRLNADRLPVVIELLQREARRISAQVNPFDPTLRRPADSLGAVRFAST